MIAKGMYGATIGLFLVGTIFLEGPTTTWDFFYAGVIVFLTGILSIIEAIEKKK